jgi:hypothetical protein
MNTRSESAQNQPKQEAKKPKRKVLRKGDFDVVARGVPREDPDIERIAFAIWEGYMKGDFDDILERARRTREAFEADGKIRS